jgi:hypothetical protein
VTAHGPWLLKFCPDCGQRNDNADKCTNDRAHPGRQPWLVREPVVLESRLREAEAELARATAVIDYSHRLRDADSGEWMDALGGLQRLGYTAVWGDELDGERALSLHHQTLPRIDCLFMDGDVWRVTVEKLPLDRARGVLDGGDDGE